MGAERALVGGWLRLARIGQKTGRPGNPKLDDETWVALLERYVRGETQAALGLDYGVSVSAVAWPARQRRLCRNRGLRAVFPGGRLAA